MTPSTTLHKANVSLDMPEGFVRRWWKVFGSCSWFCLVGLGVEVNKKTDRLRLQNRHHRKAGGPIYSSRISNGHSSGYSRPFHAYLYQVKIKIRTCGRPDSVRHSGGNRNRHDAGTLALSHCPLLTLLVVMLLAVKPDCGTDSATALLPCIWLAAPPPSLVHVAGLTLGW